MDFTNNLFGTKKNLLFFFSIQSTPVQMFPLDGYRNDQRPRTSVSEFKGTLYTYVTTGTCR